MEYHYLRLANELEQKIRSGKYRAGEKLPSLRSLRSQTGRSLSTVYQAYTELENRGVIDVRDKSGFYARPLLEKILPLPVGEKVVVRPHAIAINALSSIMQDSMTRPRMLPFGAAIPSPDLLPLKQLAGEIRRVAGKYATGECIGYGHPLGLQALRSEIAKRSVGLHDLSHGEEIIITNGCMAAIDVCLRTVARAGDIILVESPTFLCYLQLIEDLNMQILEIPADSESGLDMDLLEKALAEHDVRAALLNANFHNPLGYVMDNSSKRRLVELMGERQIPIIEDDIYGDLYFGETRPLPLKAFDREGLVLYCSSFTKSLAPDLRVGWTIPGRFREKVERLRFNASIAGSQLGQLAIAGFLAGGGYERHLRRLRNSLKKQTSDYALAVARHFPSGTRISAPRGGLCLWIELDRSVDGLQLFDRALQEEIAILPGTLCSGTDRYRHCLRLNCGYPLDERSEKGVETLGRLIGELIQEG
ncbi:MAG: PLP-dependent aminotransferase family protein [Desulfoprunum sp.]|nr:PLP-dependent aminotransferase family protein [Desulfoprunum sp.]